MQIYNQFINYCKIFIGYVTTQTLIYGALIAIAFFLFWCVISNQSSAIRKFYKRCYKLEKHLKYNKVGYENINSIDFYCGRISRGFSYGWNKFKKSNKNRKPSDYLTKRDVLDAEVSDGVLNHGKSFMKTFIGVTTALLFILNLAHIGKDLAITFNILVEAMFIPFVYYVVMILIYFISNGIKQQIYIIATAHFYDLVDALDKCFDYIDPNSIDVNFVESKKVTDDEKVLKETSESENIAESVAIVESVQESKDEAEIIKDNNSIEEVQDEETIEVVENQESKEEAEKLNLEDFEINNAGENVPDEETEKIVAVAPVARDWEAEQNLDYYDVFKKKNINVDKYINEIPTENEGVVFIDVNQEVIPGNDENLEEKKEKSEEIETIEEESDFEEDKNHPLNEFENSESKENEENIQDETIFDFDQKAAEEETESEEESSIEESSEIESNDEKIEEIEEKVEDENNVSNEEEIQAEEIEETKMPDSVDKNENIESFDSEEVFDFSELVSEVEDSVESPVEEKNEVSEEFDFFKEDADENLKLDEEVEEQVDNNAEITHNELKNHIEENLNESTREIDSKLVDNIDSKVDLMALVDEFKQNYQEDLEENKEEDLADEPNDETTKQIFAKINDLENLISTALNKDEKPNKTKKSKKGKTKMTETNQSEKKTRGRPKMQAIDENLVITTEEQFEEILSRAEKLMRKSEQGLSQSQSKRIEKELKIMMDAMNKYKEG